MKLDKNLFKAVVKECLIEILAEGLVTQGDGSRKKARLSESLTRKSQTSRSLEGLGRHTQTSQRSTASPRGSYLDNITYANKEQPYNNAATNKIPQSISNDPVMRDILADTAKTTLREQVGAETSSRTQISSRPADKAAAIVEQSNPEDLFGEASQNWATLAFS